jgi:hypothetical protein
MGGVTWSGGVEHWTNKGDIRLFLWQKKANPNVPHAGTILFVHGSSMASQPTFDLQRAGPAVFSSAMEWFRDRGFDTWTSDNEGYGRSDKHRDINSDISNGADDLAAGSAYILQPRAASSSLLPTASRRARCGGAVCERHPERVWPRWRWTRTCGPARAAHTLEQRRKKLPEFLAKNRRPIDRAFVHSIFNATTRHGGRGDGQGLRRCDPALDDSMPTRHLCGHVLATAADRPAQAHRAHRGPARRIRRHRRRWTT